MASFKVKPVSASKLDPVIHNTVIVIGTNTITSVHMETFYFA